MMPYYSKESIEKIRELDLLTYLQNYEPEELVFISKNNYTTKTHDSLKISNGMWNWFSKGIGGKSALDYLIKVRDYEFIEALDYLADKIEGITLMTKHIPERKHLNKIVLPVKAPNCYNVKSYLHNRGIDLEIIEECIQRGFIYEEDQRRNVVFVGFDSEKNPRYAAVRACNSSRYMHDASGSDKAYSFRLDFLEENLKTSLHLFESAIDALSYATLLKIKGLDWKSEPLLSLAGVYQPAKEIENSKIPIAVKYYLQNHPEIKKIFIHFDNDRAGREAALALKTVLPKRYIVFDAPPPAGKDYNDFLKKRLYENQTNTYNVEQHSGIYKIEVEEVLRRTIEIKASSTEESLNIARNMYLSEEIVLDYEDWTETNYHVLGITPIQKNRRNQDKER